MLVLTKYQYWQNNKQKCERDIYLLNGSQWWEDRKLLKVKSFLFIFNKTNWNMFSILKRRGRLTSLLFGCLSLKSIILQNPFHSMNKNTKVEEKNLSMSRYTLNIKVCLRQETNDRKFIVQVIYIQLLWYSLLPTWIVRLKVTLEQWIGFPVADSRL